MLSLQQKNKYVMT